MCGHGDIACGCDRGFVGRFGTGFVLVHHLRNYANPQFKGGVRDRLVSQTRLPTSGLSRGWRLGID